MACGLIELNFSTGQDRALAGGDFAKMQRDIRPRLRKVLILGSIQGLDIKWR